MSWVRLDTLHTVGCACEHLIVPDQVMPVDQVFVAARLKAKELYRRLKHLRSLTFFNGTVLFQAFDQSFKMAPFFSNDARSCSTSTSRGRASAIQRKRCRGTRRLTHQHGRHAHSGNCGAHLSNRVTASGDQQIVYLLWQERPVRNVIRLDKPQRAMPALIQTMEIDDAATQRDGVVKASALDNIVERQHIFADDPP